ncbi:hypothetical protein HLB23_37740 [Nocardia uniformis]|uniref:Uncharacterized protein n=1 Tax=Nocardia uniformis TaxID=53432 RepID=A0A849CHP8_9NOCA|nr:hypothetical protein [Nocardia uniformis]NNH75529.1 hypothetical protein [Nocardia uniformis]
MADPIPLSPLPLSDAHRESFWRRVGWTPNLPAREREAIEQRWDDETIDLAETFGW